MAAGANIRGTEMNKPYYVMLEHPNGEYILPLVDGNNEIAQYADKDSAISGAESSSLGSKVGYKVFNYEEQK